MKFRKSGQALLAAAATVAVGLGMTSCGASNTVDFVYVTSNKNNPGQVNVYKADSESGALRQIPDSPYPSGGRNPVADVASPNGQNLYVLNRDDNTIVVFAIGTDGKLYPLTTCNTPGTEPSALAISPDGSLLYVVDFYQAGFTDVNPGPGALAVFNINAKNGGLGTNNTAGQNNAPVATPNCTPVANGNLSYWPLANYPGSVAVTADGSHVYVADPNVFVTTTTPPTTGTTPTSSGLPGEVFGFSVGSGGTLTAVGGSPWTTGSGTLPVGIAAHPSGSYLYVTDIGHNQLLNYAIDSSGALSTNPALNGSTITTGTTPISVVLDATGAFLFVSNFGDGTVDAYGVGSSGVPTPNASPTVASGSGSTCLLIDPGLNRFLFTTNFTGGNVSSTTLNSSTGELVANQNSPYATSGQPTCVAAIEHGRPPAAAAAQ